MEKDLEKELEEVLKKHKMDNKCCECEIGKGFTPIFDNSADLGVWYSLLLMTLFDKPIKEEPKQPIINIYLGGDK